MTANRSESSAGRPRLDLECEEFNLPVGALNGAETGVMLCGATCSRWCGRGSTPAGDGARDLDRLLRGRWLRRAHRARAACVRVGTSAAGADGRSRTVPEAAPVPLPPAAALDEVVHGRDRPGVLRILAAADDAGFCNPRRTLGLADGTFGRHLAVCRTPGTSRCARGATAGGQGLRRRSPLPAGGRSWSRSPFCERWSTTSRTPTRGVAAAVLTSARLPTSQPVTLRGSVRAEPMSSRCSTWLLPGHPIHVRLTASMRRRVSDLRFGAGRESMRTPLD